MTKFELMQQARALATKCKDVSVAVMKSIESLDTDSELSTTQAMHEAAQLTNTAKGLADDCYALWLSLGAIEQTHMKKAAQKGIDDRDIKRLGLPHVDK